MTILNLEDLDQYKFEDEADIQKLLEETKESLKILLTKDIPKLLSNIQKQLEKKLQSVLRNFSNSVLDAFRVETVSDYFVAVKLYGEELSTALYGLQLQFTGLKMAVIQLAAPLLQVLLPAVQTVIGAITRLTLSIAQALQTFFLGSQTTDGFTDSVNNAVTGSNKLKKSLAGFDQITRLSDNSSSGSILSSQTITELTGNWKKLSDKLTQILSPLKALDFTPAAKSLERLKTALEPITRTLFAGLEWAWYNLFVPLAQWTVEKLLPVFLDTLTAALNGLGRIVEELKPVFQWLWENFLKPLAQWAGDQIISGLQGLTDKLNGVSGWIGKNQSPVDKIIASGKSLSELLAQMVTDAMGLNTATNAVSGSFGTLLQGFFSAINPFSNTNTALGAMSTTLSGLANAFGLVDTASSTVWGNIKSIWEKAWNWLKEKTVDPAYSGLKDTVNAIIGLINRMLSGFCTGINTVSGAVNKLSFKVPDWVPVIGGKQMGFDLKTVTAPQIPYLAQGAVLPANKPFMAVVGDQRHGTNIEAPLTTIQEAVALVMQDQTAALLAGFEASVGVQRQILEAVLGIHIGDETIAAAAQRYSRKMAVLTGG